MPRKKAKKGNNNAKAEKREKSPVQAGPWQCTVCNLVSHGLSFFHCIEHKFCKKCSESVAYAKRKACPICEVELKLTVERVRREIIDSKNQKLAKVTQDLLEHFLPEPKNSNCNLWNENYEEFGKKCVISPLISCVSEEEKLASENITEKDLENDPPILKKSAVERYHFLEFCITETRKYRQLQIDGFFGDGKPLLPSDTHLEMYFQFLIFTPFKRIRSQEEIDVINGWTEKFELYKAAIETQNHASTVVEPLLEKDSDIEDEQEHVYNISEPLIYREYQYVVPGTNEEMILSGEFLEQTYWKILNELKEDGPLTEKDLIVIFQDELPDWVRGFMRGRFPGHAVEYRIKGTLYEKQNEAVNRVLQKVGRHQDKDQVFTLIATTKFEDWFMSRMDIPFGGTKIYYLPPFATVTDPTGKYPYLVGAKPLYPMQRRKIKNAVTRQIFSLKKQGFDIVIARKKHIWKWIRDEMSENFPFLGLRLLNPDDTDTLWEKKYTATVDDFLDRSKLTYMDVLDMSIKDVDEGMSMWLPDNDEAPLLRWLDTAYGRKFSGLDKSSVFFNRVM